jgi:dynactin complex subunit
MTKLTLEELAESLDQMFFEIADLREQVESMGNMLAERDKTNLLMVKHVERLTREKEVLLMHMGLNSMRAAPKPKPKPLEEMTLRELLEKLK